MNIEKIIKQTFEEVFAENNQISEMPNLDENLVLLESGLDSLGFAVLVVKLEEKLEFDPFILSETPYYPQSLGEFIKFYEDNQPK
jgi:acyl carrier protein